MGRAIIDRAVMHIEDLAAVLDEFPDAREVHRQFGQRTSLAVPLVRDNKAFGGILLRRKVVRPFSARQIDLVKTFADQAVIAIENVRLFKELDARNRELTELLNQQTATAECSRSFRSSPTNVQPVFDTIVESAVRLCNGIVQRHVHVRWGVDTPRSPQHNFTPEAVAERSAYIRRVPAARLVPRARSSSVPVVHIPDVELDPDYAQSASTRAAVCAAAFSFPCCATAIRSGWSWGAATAGRFSDSEIESSRPSPIRQ